jgi:hypothetical protein
LKDWPRKKINLRDCLVGCSVGYGSLFNKIINLRI